MGRFSSFDRLTIAAVAATAAGTRPEICNRQNPPHDCRSRGDCGGAGDYLRVRDFSRLTIAAVAATAARSTAISGLAPRSASRLPQSRRLRPRGSPIASTSDFPPHDCRSRGDCGLEIGLQLLTRRCRLTIAAVAATAAWKLSEARKKIISRLTIAAVAATAAIFSPACPSERSAASRLPQSRRLRPAWAPTQ